MHLKKTIEY